MKYLIDTHVCFWAIFENQKLSTHTKNLLENPAIDIVVSQISLWEIAIKHQVGKMPDFKVQLSDFIHAISDAGFTFLPLKNEHLITYFNCSWFSHEHKDPFDRLLIVTADVEKAGFITKDDKFSAYTYRATIVW